MVAPDNPVPTANRFIYSRLNTPLFFTPPTSDEFDIWSSSRTDLTREFFRNNRKHDGLLHPSIPLSNGMTGGEFSMWFVRYNHIKRLNKTKQL